MKSVFGIFILLFGQLVLVAQSPNWEAYLLVDQTWNGNTDTIWFGVDYDATNGYDAEWDVMDSTFNYPLAMRLQNGQVQSDSNTCAANMRRDIKAFAPEVTWDVFVKADTFTADENLPIDSNFFLRWDTAQFNYSDGQYFLNYAFIRTTTGYIGGIDGDGFCLSSNSSFCDFEAGGLSIKVPIIYVGIQPPEYNSSFCATEDYIFKFTLHLVFDDLLSINSNTNTDIEFINQTKDKSLQIQNNSDGWIRIEVFGLNGSKLFSASSYEKSYSFNYSAFTKGLFFVRVVDEDGVGYGFSVVNY
ncbi:MAG: hypothetical protein IPL48_14565 [Bacteroidetes bacterium]|nr:hypothetical protein [Bacteroidota bacterium]